MRTTALLLLAACGPEPLDPASLLAWGSFDPVVVTGEPGRNRSAVVTGGAVAVDALGWRVASARRDRVEVWRPGDDVPRVIELPDGWDPGQVAILSPGRALVALRGAGAVLAITLGPELSARAAPVCGEPRGIGVDAADGTAWVACRTGELAHVTADGEVLASFEVDDDLRDVVVDGDRLWVSRLRAAEVLEVSPVNGSIEERHRLGGATRVDQFGFPWAHAASVAWRMIRHPDGGVAVLHQLHQSEPVSGWGPYYGEADPAAGTCDAVVLGRVSRVVAGESFALTAPFAASVPFDLAFTPEGQMVVAATGFAGYPDANVAVVTSPWEPCAALTPMLEADGARLGSAVALDAHGRASFSDGAEVASATFYDAQGAVIACASCHPDGQEDGQVWTLTMFSGEPRRTPPLSGGLAATAPYHWDGLFADLDELWETVGFLMGQTTPDPDEVAAVAAWLEGIPAPLPPEEPDADLAAEGAALFAALGCAECHPPPTFTNGETMDVGTGGEFQVPSLRGVSARLPIMHDGCADPLGERFTLPHCGGGVAHGAVVGAPDDEDIVALVAYLQAL